VSGAKSSSATGTTGIAEPGLYCGRFAPSPTGPLHFGSLIAAVGSYLEARTYGGRWLLRIEDLDPPREQPGASERILLDLELFGFEWDGPVVYQSRRAELYERALARLDGLGLIRRCGCSRRQLESLAENRARADGDELYHPPDCIRPAGAGGETLRFRAADRVVEFADRSRGRVAVNVARTVGDFVLRRRDGLHAYQLAVTVDDAEQRVTDVVRGADLLSSTPRQNLIQQALGYATPGYLHLPLAVGASGSKLSKSTDAPALAAARPAVQLVTALTVLRQQPPACLAGGNVADVWHWARANWRPERFQGLTTIKVDDRPTGSLTQE
jgi:glutamyl-Q tRNA(Asp) synthetase